MVDVVRIHKVAESTTEADARRLILAMAHVIDRVVDQHPDYRKTKYCKVCIALRMLERELNQGGS